MKIIIKNSESEFVEKKSRFISHSFAAYSEAQALCEIEKKSLHFRDATHHVYAYRIMENNILKVKFFDAGEPKNTAGKPIVSLLCKLNLINTLIVVTRYFGGVKLGASSLLRAYLRSAKDVIAVSDLQEYVQKKIVELSFGYNLVVQVENLLKERPHASILNKNFTDTVSYKISADSDTIKLLGQQLGIVIKILEPI